MKKSISTLILVLTTIIFCAAQKIETTKMFSGYKYTQNGNRMTMGDLVNTMKSHPQAFELIKKARSNNTFASIFSSAGGTLIGWPIGTALGGGDANWTLAGIGVGLIAIGIPFSSSTNKRTNEAVEVYNSSLNLTSFFECKPVFKVISNGNGIGLAMNF